MSHEPLHLGCTLAKSSPDSTNSRGEVSMRGLIPGSFLLLILLAVCLIPDRSFVSQDAQLSSGTVTTPASIVNGDQVIQPNTIIRDSKHPGRTASSSITGCNTISDCAYQLLTERVNFSRKNFFVY